MSDTLPIETPWQPPVVTSWAEIGAALLPDSQADAEKHRLFGNLARQTMRDRFPWLERILEGGQARVVAHPGLFMVEVPAGSGNWSEITELSRSLRLTPWRDEGDACA